MKTIGLIALMHQSGLQIPAAEGSAIPVFEGVFADIGDQQSISESVSTFGSHVSNVVRILRHASRRSLVLLDELGTSTDPDEGSALAKAIIGHLARRNIATVATTHHRSVAAFAETSDDMTNASFQLDPDTLKPTYRMTIGIPGRSYAMAIAERLGLPKDILEESRSLMEPQHLLFEDWLNELQRERTRLQTSVEEASIERAEAASLRRKLEEQVEYLVDHHDENTGLRPARTSWGRFQDISRKLEGAEASLKWEVPVAVSGAPPPVRDRIQRIRRELGAVEPAAPAPIQRPKRTSRAHSRLETGCFIRGMKPPRHSLAYQRSERRSPSQYRQRAGERRDASSVAHRGRRLRARSIRRISSQLGPCPRARQHRARSAGDAGWRRAGQPRRFSRPRPAGWDREAPHNPWPRDGHSEKRGARASALSPGRHELRTRTQGTRRQRRDVGRDGLRRGRSLDFSAQSPAPVHRPRMRRRGDHCRARRPPRSPLAMRCSRSRLPIPHSRGARACPAGIACLTCPG